MKRSKWFAIVCLLSSPGIASAQIGAEGTVRGVVREPQGAAMAGVVVRTASPEAPGFSRSSRAGIALRADPIAVTLGMLENNCA